MRAPDGARPATGPDPVTTQVIRSALTVAAAEAGIVVVKAAYSSFIQEGADAAAALLGADGSLVAQSQGTTIMHAASLRACLPALLEDVPVAHMAPGDVYVMNDQFRGGIHANDLVIFRPVFAPVAEPDADVDRTVLWFAGTLIHVADVGGVAAGGVAATATDTFAEGLMLPPVALLEAGHEVRAVWRIIEANSRAPDKVVGDVRALVAGSHVLARRVEELMARYGVAVLTAEIDRWLADTEALVRQGLRTLPPGEYRGGFLIDGDGVEAGRTHDVRVRLVLDGPDGAGGVVVDLGGTGPQARGSINSSFSQTISGVIFALRCFLDPDLPMNEGCFAPVTIVMPAGSLVNPARPAACGGRIVVVTAVIEAIIEALSSALPGRSVAGSGIVHLWSLAGVRPVPHGASASQVATAPWMHMGFDFGGLGGRWGIDGPDATGAFTLGGRAGLSQLEPLEAQFPFVVERMALIPDSGGAGRFRGGLGIEIVIALDGPATVTVRGDRIAVPPPGRDGGRPGAPGAWQVQRVDGTVETLSVKAVGVPLAPGDRFIVRTSGGGGLGDPAERDRESLAADVRSGRVSARAAEQEYGA